MYFKVCYKRIDLTPFVFRVQVTKIKEKINLLTDLPSVCFSCTGEGLSPGMKWILWSLMITCFQVLPCRGLQSHFLNPGCQYRTGWYLYSRVIVSSFSPFSLHYIIYLFFLIILAVLSLIFQFAYTFLKKLLPKMGYTVPAEAFPMTNKKRKIILHILLYANESQNYIFFFFSYQIHICY